LILATPKDSTALAEPENPKTGKAEKKDDDDDD